MDIKSTVLSLLARIPADHWGFDAVAALVVIGAIALVALGYVTPDQLPQLIDAAYWGLGLIGVRAAALKAKAAAKQAAAVVVAAPRKDALAAAVEAANVLRLPPKDGA